MKQYFINIICIAEYNIQSMEVAYNPSSDVTDPRKANLRRYDMGVYKLSRSVITLAC